MRKNTLTVRMLFNVNGQVFNVDNKGSKSRWDPITQKTYIYASADNVKHNIRETYLEISDEEKPKDYYAKDISVKEDKDKQGAVYTDATLDNDYVRLFGIWNPEAISIKKKKYNKWALKSVINVADMLPLHTFLVSTSEQTGVRVGKSSDQVYFIKGKGENQEHFFSVEELVEKAGKTKEEAYEMFQNSRASNFYQKNDTTSGLYYEDYVINLNEIKYPNIANVSLSEEEREYFTSKYGMTVINGDERLIIPTQDAIKIFNILVDSLFEWDFTSNNSTHGSIKERLRTSIALNNVSLWQQSTSAVINEDNKTASIKLFTKSEDEMANVYSYNNETLRKFYNKENIDYTIFADKLAIEKIKELGKEVLEKI